MISPGSTIGIMGGGQLGRMLAIAAAEMGYETHIFCPNPEAVAAQVANHHTVAEYDNRIALMGFASSVDVISFEFENIPAESLEALAQQSAVHPSPNILSICRNRLREKQFINECGIETAPYRAVRSVEDVEAAAAEIGTPLILKTTEMGYDGKGQARVNDAAEAKLAWLQLGEPEEAIAEGFVDFGSECSVIVARNEAGEVACYPAVSNYHENHILSVSQLPAKITPEMADRAEQMARTLAERLGLVGLLAVELFACTDGRLVVNELAPRPHNSGHITMEACETSQFHQHIRAICGLPLGSTRMIAAAKMQNIIGSDIENWQEYLQQPHAHLHLYGKKEVREGRKMGHVTTLSPKLPAGKVFVAGVGES